MTEVPIKFERARHHLLVTQPFYSTLLLNAQVSFVETINVHTEHGTFAFPIPTAATDGKQFFFNPKYVEKITQAELEGVIVHEILHKVFLHTLRMKERDREKWNIATDAVINQIALDADFELPGSFVDLPKYKDSTAEYVYDHLSNKEMEGFKQDGNGIAHLVPMGNMSESARAQFEREVKIDITSAANLAREAGKLPDSIARLVAEMNAPKVDWREQLRNYMVEVNVNDYSWKRPNKRYLHENLYLPTLRSFQMGPIIICFDTSGSIYSNQDLVVQFASEVNSIINDMVPMQTDVIYCDTQIQQTDHFDMGEEFIPNLKGGGGTDFESTFEHIEEEMTEASVLVFMTDLYAGGIPDSCSVPTIWCVYDNDNATVPFGEVVYLEKD